MPRKLFPILIVLSLILLNIYGWLLTSKPIDDIYTTSMASRNLLVLIASLAGGAALVITVGVVYWLVLRRRTKLSSKAYHSAESIHMLGIGLVSGFVAVVIMLVLDAIAQFRLGNQGDTQLYFFLTYYSQVCFYGFVLSLSIALFGLVSYCKGRFSTKPKL